MSNDSDDTAATRRTILSRWFADVAAAVAMLFGTPRPGAAITAAPRSAWPIVPLGLVVGLLWVATFRGTWRLFGDLAGLRLLPSLAVVVLDAFITSRCLLVATARLASGAETGLPRESNASPSEWSTIVIVVSLLALFALILSLPHLPGWWPTPGDWRSRFNWMYPYPIYRPLLLAPIWGRWGCLVALCMGRAAPDADALTRGYIQSLRPHRLLAHSILPLLLTTIYCSRGRNLVTGPMIATIVLAITVLFATLVTHRRGGQTRVTVLTTGLAAQIVFLIVYRGFWRLIE